MICSSTTNKRLDITVQCGFYPIPELSFLNIGIGLVEDLVKELLQKICCRQVCIGAEHNMYLIKLVLFQILFVFEKKLARVFKIYSVCACKYLLYIFSDGFKRPYRLPYPVVFIDHISGIRKIRLGYLGIRNVHIADEVFYSGTVCFLEIFA